jgi:hypothetical protein
MAPGRRLDVRPGFLGRALRPHHGDLFDGFVNVGSATAMLSEYQRSCTVAPDHHRRYDRRHP